MTGKIPETESFEPPETSNSFDDWERPDPIIVDEWVGGSGGVHVVYRCNQCGGKREGYKSTGQIYFCSKSCYMTYRNLVVNPTIKHGRHWSRKRRLAMMAVVERGYEDFTTCEICDNEIDDPKLAHFHHEDGDPWNNSPDNVVFCCMSCHMKQHEPERERNELGQYA